MTTPKRWFLGLLLTLLAAAPTAQAAPPQVDTSERLLLMANAQNLVSRWNNVLIGARSGREVIERFQAAGIFSDDVELHFDLGEHKPRFRGLAATEAFYDGFFGGMTKPHFNWVGNVEALEFQPGELRFRFRHGLFLGGRLSLAGDNEAVLRRAKQGYRIAKVWVRVVHYDVAHGMRTE